VKTFPSTVVFSLKKEVFIMPPSNLSHYIFETNKQNKPWMDKRVIPYKHNHCFKTYQNKKKHNYLTIATICMRNLAAISWCLELLRREGRTGK